MITARARISPNTAQCPTPSPTHRRRPLVRRSPSQDPSALWHAAAGTPSAAAGSSDPWKPQCSTCCSCSDLRVSGTAAYRPGSASRIAKIPDPTGIREVSETSWGGCAHCSPAIETAGLPRSCRKAASSEADGSHQQGLLPLHRAPRHHLSPSLATCAAESGPTPGRWAR
jgi:hypothetical protein